MSEPNINTKALEDAINEIKDERFQKDLREWLIFGAPLEVQAIWKRYIEKAEAEDKRKAEMREDFARRAAEAHMWFRLLTTGLVIAAVGFTTYEVYEMFTLTAGCPR